MPAARATKTATAKKAAAPRAPRTAPAAAPQERETPLVVFATSAAPAPAKQVPIFEINGRMFHANAKPLGGVLMHYLRLLRTDTEQAYMYLIEALCGIEAFNALADDPATDVDRIVLVVAALRRLLQGSAQDPKA
jgi:hypothetical protein